MLPHRSDFDIISPYSILVNTFLHFFKLIFQIRYIPRFYDVFDNLK
nr:MAG TPA: hypothetical protein [Caudoviricetes sp.]